MHPKRISYEERGMRPLRDWDILLVTSCLTLLFIALFAFYFYGQINQGKLFIVTQNDVDREVKINANLLQKITNEIKLRETTLQSIKQNKAIPSDPSL